MNDSAIFDQDAILAGLLQFGNSVSQSSYQAVIPLAYKLITLGIIKLNRGLWSSPANAKERFGKKSVEPAFARQEI
jgi:hypothetical protein